MYEYKGKRGGETQTNHFSRRMGSRRPSSVVPGSHYLRISLVRPSGKLNTHSKKQLIRHSLVAAFIYQSERTLRAASFLDIYWQAARPPRQRPRQAHLRTSVPKASEPSRESTPGRQAVTVHGEVGDPAKSAASFSLWNGQADSSGARESRLNRREINSDCAKKPGSAEYCALQSDRAQATSSGATAAHSK